MDAKRKFPMYALVACMAIVLGDITDFRLKSVLMDALSKSRLMSSAFLFMFVFFCVVSGKSDETLKDVRSSFVTSSIVFLALCSLNYVPDHLLFFVVAQLVADYVMQSCRNGARTPEEVEFWDFMMTTNVALAGIIVLGGMADTYSEFGAPGLVEVAFPLKRT